MGTLLLLASLMLPLLLCVCVCTIGSLALCLDFACACYTADSGIGSTKAAGGDTRANTKNVQQEV
jgi:hypothetical protein